MADRFLIAATVDRLIYDSETTFSAEDARTLLEALPRKRAPWFQFGFRGKFSGGSTTGFAAGVGDVRIESDKERQLNYDSTKDSSTRAGQWKLLYMRQFGRQYVEIEQVMADSMEDGRAALLCYEGDDTPFRMDIRVSRSFSLFWTPVVIVIPAWKAWKTPDHPTSSTIPS